LRGKSPLGIVECNYSAHLLASIFRFNYER
jgi:hypothetical protein